jgi:hypothetical protein
MGGGYAGGRHTGNPLMHDAEIRQDLVMRQVGHVSPEISQRYDHPPKQAHLAAAGQVAALVRKAGNWSRTARMFPVCSSGGVPRTRDISNVSTGQDGWCGWGSNSRPADYEKPGRVRRTHYLHGYDRVVPLMAPIAVVAPMVRSTRRSTAAAPDPFIPLLYVTLRPIGYVRCVRSQWPSRMRSRT